MANIRSAEKRNRQAQKRRLRNVGVRTGIKGVVKKAREALGKGDVKSAEHAIKEAARTLAKAASKGILHRNNAERRISRLNVALAKLGSSARPA